MRGSVEDPWTTVVDNPGPLWTRAAHPQAKARERVVTPNKRAVVHVLSTPLSPPHAQVRKTSYPHSYPQDVDKDKVV